MLKSFCFNCCYIRCTGSPTSFIACFPSQTCFSSIRWRKHFNETLGSAACRGAPQMPCESLGSPTSRAHTHLQRPPRQPTGEAGRLATFNHHPPRWPETLMGCFISSYSQILSAFCCCQGVGKKQESKTLSFKGTSDFLNPLSTLLILLQTQTKRTRQRRRGLNLHPSMYSTNMY